MKKFTSTGLGGAPLNKNDLKTIFNDEIWSATEAILSPFIADTEGIIVSGCIITGGGPYSISAGIVFLNGEFMRLPAQTGLSLPQYIIPSTPVGDSRVFGDGTTQVVAVNKSAIASGSLPGSGQYIAITSSTDPDDRRYENIFVNKQKVESFKQGVEVLGGLRTQNSGDYYKFGEDIGLMNQLAINISGSTNSFDNCSPGMAVMGGNNSNPPATANDINFRYLVFTCKNENALGMHQLSITLVGVGGSSTGAGEIYRRIKNSAGVWNAWILINS